MTIKLKDNERLDDLQRNGYQIIQNPKKFCFGMDAVLLSGFVEAKPNQTILDLGTGNGIIPLLLAGKTNQTKIYGLEIQNESVDMAKRSVQLNNLQDRIQIVEGDIKEASTIFERESFDVITCNPPYMIGEHGLKNAEEPKLIARHEVLCTFEDVIKACKFLLKPGGKFFLVHRPFRLVEIMTAMSSNKIEPKRLRLVHPYIDKEPNMVLIEAKKDAKSRITIEKPLIVYEKANKYTQEIYDIYSY